MVFLKKLFSTLLCACQIHHIFRYINRKKIVVLAYHGVTETKLALPLWGQLEYKRFKEQLDYICRFHNVIPIEYLAEYLGGNRDIPDNSVVITFDDGYRNNYELAYPLLLKYSLPATFFITPNFIDSQEILWSDKVAIYLWSYQGQLTIPLLGLQVTINEKNRINIIDMIIQKCKTLDPDRRQNVLDYLKESRNNKISENGMLRKLFEPMSWEQVRKLDQSSLITIGAHTADHLILAQCSPEAAKDQIARSKQTLDNILDRPVRFFAYPNGKMDDFDDTTKILMNKSGFKLACTTIRRLVAIGDDPHEIGRFCIGNDLTSYKDFFYLTVSGFFYYFQKWSNALKIRSLFREVG